MFFIIGITNGRKRLNYQKMVICNQCGRYGRYEAFMTYTSLTLFFIPILKWGRRYYVSVTCCNSLYELSKEKGERLRKGQVIEIEEVDLTLVESSKYTEQWSYHPIKNCQACGYETKEAFDYCPKCGNQLEESGRKQDEK